MNLWNYQLQPVYRFAILHQKRDGFAIKFLMSRPFVLGGWVDGQTNTNSLCILEHWEVLRRQHTIQNHVPGINSLNINTIQSYFEIQYLWVTCVKYKKAAQKVVILSHESEQREKLTFVWVAFSIMLRLGEYDTYIWIHNVYIGRWACDIGNRPTYAWFALFRYL